jgi:Cof subfamily protein (haloacid dehalogenase superfamily)
LLTVERSLAPGGVRSLRQAIRQGIYVVLSTTRNPGGTRLFCQEIGTNAPMICTNGAQIWGSPEGPVWACHTFPQKVALAIAQLADTRGWELSTTVGAMTYWRQRPGQPLGLYRPRTTVVARNIDAIVGDPVRILTWQPEAVETVRSLCETQFPGQCYTTTYHRPDGTVESLSISAPQADKGTALRMVLQRLGIAPEQAVAIGDNANDVPMFKVAGTSIAMGNALPGIKTHADAVAPDHKDEGVAWAVQRFVLDCP